MNKLLIYIGESEKFDLEHTVSVLSAIDGVRGPRIGNFIGAAFECEYVWNGLSTIVRISPELETVTVEGLDDGALQFAIEFQRRTSVELHAVDMDCSFNVSLGHVCSVAELRRVMQS
jgi:hypothetical protein